MANAAATRSKVGAGDFARYGMGLGFLAQASVHRDIVEDCHN